MNLPLFDQVQQTVQPPQVSPASYQAVRRQARQRAFERADAAFLANYEAVLIEYGQCHADFTAAEVTAIYDERYGSRGKDGYKALGGLFTQLRKSGVIEATGTMRARKNGNKTEVYRLADGTNRDVLMAEFIDFCNQTDVGDADDVGEE